MSNTEENQLKLLKNSNFHQQSLPSWNPVILITTIYPLFGSFGVAFILIGISLLLSSISIGEFQYDYTHCNEYEKLHNNYTNRKCSEVLNANYTSDFQSCLCNIQFKLDKKFEGQVYFYYSLKNFYQNHRRYFSSRDNNQLLGKSIKTVSEDCRPFDQIRGNITLNYAPCGLIANSLFNDTFQLSFINSTNSIPVSMTKKGIAWKVDTNFLFGKPNDWLNTLKPMNWKYSARERNNDSYNGDEDLLVWMRTAPLSTFKKLSGIIKHDSYPFTNGLPAGDYELLINYSYPVSVFGGTKLIFLSTTSAMGGKNNNIGIMYIALGSIHELIALIFLMFTLFRQKKKTSFSDTPLITSPLTPESYGLKEIPFQNDDKPKIR